MAENQKEVVIIPKRPEPEFLFCLKHYFYQSPTLEAAGLEHTCPRCEFLRDKALCVDCEKHSAEMNYAESVLDWNHFGSQRLCRCCALERIRPKFLAYQSLEKELAENPCVEVPDGEETVS